MEEKIRSTNKILKSLTIIVPIIVLGMIVNLISNLVVSYQINSNVFIVFGILIVLVVITIVITTIFNIGSPKDATLKDSMKKAYTNAIDRSDLNPAPKRRLER